MGCGQSKPLQDKVDDSSPINKGSNKIISPNNNINDKQRRMKSNSNHSGSTDGAGAGSSPNAAPGPANTSALNPLTISPSRAAKKKIKNIIASGPNNADISSNTKTRTRSDTWEPHDITSAGTGSTAAMQQEPMFNPIVQQWKFLWETQSQALVDPADVHSVMDHLMDQTVNLLSSVQLNFIQRRVRFVINQLPNKNKKTDGGSMIKLKVFQSTAANSNTTADLVEAKVVAQKLHLLAPPVLQRILPKNIASIPIQENIITLCMALSSDALNERLQVAAQAAAKAVEIEMDVNKTESTKNKMPKPSQVPVLEQPVDDEWPVGASLLALSTILALASAGTRIQKLHLLFYILQQEHKLGQFLASHPAGGVPIWLLEVDQNVVLSLPSLTHYHYFGTSVFLPISQTTKIPNFTPSKSRTPITVHAETVQSILLQVLELDSTNTHNGTAIMNGGTKQQPTSPKRQSFVRNTKQQEDNDPNMDTSENNHLIVASILNKNNSQYASVAVHIQSVAEGLKQDIYMQGNTKNTNNTTNHNNTNNLANATSTLYNIFNNKLQQNVSSDSTRKEYWTLQDFWEWAELVLDDITLNAVLHKLVCQGTLPSPAMEYELVETAWESYHKKVASVDEDDNAIRDNSPSLLDTDSPSVTEMISSVIFGADNNNHKHQRHPSDESNNAVNVNSIFGGIGNIDGLGGLGNGVLYCIPASWWNEWNVYVLNPASKRPSSLQTESLLEHEEVIRGVMGSYELMRENLQRDKDYVLVPPSVWNILYELYGGGPPLPRMVLDEERSANNGNKQRNRDPPGAARFSLSLHGKIPSNVSVLTHPWILHVHICDPTQPYRRGDTGPISIRMMVAPEQPVWRVLGESVCRFSFPSYKAFDADGKGIVRLWKRMDPGKEVPRYGPWNLLCKSRYAILPLTTSDNGMEPAFQTLVNDWMQYGDNATVESIGLVDQDCLMLEYAVVNKNGILTWPREAAAEAGKVRRLAEEDRKFHQLMEGLDDDGNVMLKPPNLIGMEVDAMDPSGRWFTVKIVDVEIADDDTEEEGDEEDEHGVATHEAKKRVKVHFKDHHGGHFEWINVDSDRLQTAGRFAAGEAEKQETMSPSQSTHGTNGENKSKSAAGAKRSSSAAESSTALETTKSCPLPGFGSCGLTNLGNTCYMNSAIQCMAYLPLLRSYLLNAQYKATGDLNKDNPLGTGGKLLEEFADLLRVIWSTKIAEKSPSRFRTQLAKTNPQFSGADQQDAQEFLNYIIDVLHEDSNKVRKKPYVESLEDSWLEKTSLPRVGEEAWRRFLRRNRSIMADVAMGQALNTVTCPVCKYSSRNFDPFNLLSIPIPTVADVIFQCIVIRRATAKNCPWVLNKPRKNEREKRSSRYSGKVPIASGPPSEGYIAEQYVIALSRLADGGDLRLQIQNLSGIRANCLRLCRSEEIIYEGDVADESILGKQIKVIPLADKEGPASQHAKKRAPNDPGPPTTQIIAFENTLNSRRVDDDKDDETDEDSGDETYPSKLEKSQIERYLKIYGDERECRLVDTDPLVLAKAVSRSLWPRSESELKIGLRVDAKDHRGNWFPGSIVDIFDEEVNGGDADTGQEVTLQQRKVRIHFDNFLPKWDEEYSIDSFRKGRVNPLYSHSEPKPKPTEFLVHHRFTDRNNNNNCLFGQSFYVQCKTEWSNARAGAHILAQSTRFLRNTSEKTMSAISDLIDLLIDCDREFIRLSLGVSRHNSEEERSHPFRNSKFDGSAFIAATNKKVSALLHRLPFELLLCSVEKDSTGKTVKNTEEIVFPYALNATIGNFVSIRNAFVLQWRESITDKNTNSKVAEHSIFYANPKVEIHNTSAEILDNVSKLENGKTDKPGSAGIDLGFCLTEFCKVQKLPMSDNWKCPRCKVIREGGQSMTLWRLPDLLTFHIKRFNMSARWHEKIITKVNFPMTGLDMSQWCHKESPVLREDPEDSYVYDLIGIMNHYGSMTGGHYVATCKATLCGKEGREEVAYNFNGFGTSIVDVEDDEEPSGWTLGRSKPKTNQSRVEAAMSSKAVADSAEPMWLQFDDEVVEAIPPRLVVSEMAYVLFYRRRRMTPSNMAKYSTLE